LHLCELSLAAISAMQRSALAALLLAASAQVAVSLKLVKDSPVAQVVTLLEELKTTIETDGKSEQSSYDKYACWCEDTLAQKASEISAAKAQIEELQVSITKLGAEIATHEAEIKQTEKDIAQNEESRREAQEVRDKQYATYEEERVESEQCIGALEAAVKVLTGAGSKKGFLETFQEAQVLSIVAGVRGLLSKPMVEKSMKEQDLTVVRRFVENPEEFVGGRSGMLSAAQIANNPFGDYAPQSSQIQGILKGMYDTFASDLEKSNADESKKAKTFAALMETKKAEFEALQETLQSHTMDSATKTKDLADSKASLDDTKEQLEADEIFFAETKDTCRARANQWAQRSRLRTEELQGIAQAVKVLSSDEAKKTFESATTTFLQLHQARKASGDGNLQRGIAYDHLTGVAKKTQSLALARIAVALKTGGHFNKIIHMIENMIQLLRDEEQQDITEKKWCEDKMQKNRWDLQDLDRAIKKAETGIERHGSSIKELDEKITELEGTIEASEKTLQEMKDMRTKEYEDFLKAQRDDVKAIELIEQAIVHLTKFYHAQGVSLELAQGTKRADPAPKPELSWAKEGASYGGRQGEHEGVVAILGMIKEDLKNELKNGSVEDGEGATNMASDMGHLQETLQAQTKSKRQVEMEKAELEGKIADLEELKGLKEDDQSAEKDNEGALGTKCKWLETHFDSRRSKREAEVDGLIDAKSYLAGMSE